MVKNCMAQDNLIARIIKHSGLIKYPPVSWTAIGEAERELGFPLPPFLRELYLRVGNGGFGPRGGLIGLNSAGLLDEGFFTIVSGYRNIRNRENQNPPPFPWPKQVLLLTTLNDRFWTALDCKKLPAPVLCLDMHEYDFNESPFEDFLMPEASSLEAWFEDWLDGKVKEESA